MLSSARLQSLQVWSGRSGLRLRTLVALCTYLRHWRSSVASERRVPKEVKIVLKEHILRGYLRCHAFAQLGNALRVTWLVMCSVKMRIVKSENLRGRGGVPAFFFISCGCHPMLHAAVMGPMMEHGLWVRRSHISFRMGLL